MSTWGVYSIQGRTREGRTVAKDDKTASQWFVRWRVDGVLHRKTLPTKGYAKTFRDLLVRAGVMEWEADEDGRPVDPDSTPSPGQSGSMSGSPGLPTVVSTRPIQRSFASYCTDVWWPIMGPTFGDKNRLGHRNNMRTAITLLTYSADDPRREHADVAPGDSILLHHLTSDDLRRAVVARRGINDRTRGVNDRLLARALAEGRTDITLRDVEASPATVRSFFVTLAMIVKAAKSSGHTVGDPLEGVSRLAPAPKPSPFVQRMVPSIDEVFDLADVMATLGPVENGRPRGDRFRALVLAAGTLGPRPGELVAHRPELIRFKTAEFVPGSPSQNASSFVATVVFEQTEASVYDTETDLRGRRLRALKHRTDGEYREVPALPEVAEALRVHLERGYSGHERTFTSATGRGRLDWGNLTDTYWRPACERVFAGTSKADLALMPPKTLRKAAITYWLESGISRHEAASWAGHSAEVADLYYAGRSATTFDREVAMLTNRRNADQERDRSSLDT